MKAIEVISIPVTDQEKAKDFYLNMGFHVIVEAPMGNGQNWVQLGLSGSEVSITLVTWFPKMPAGCIQGLLIETDNIEEDRDMLQSKGIAVGDIDNTPWGKFASIKDIDGNGWSLHQR